MPLTIPLATDAKPFEADHTPPVCGAVRVIEAPGQTLSVPLIIPALTGVSTETVVAAM